MSAYLGPVSSIAARLLQLADEQPAQPAFEWFVDFRRSECWTWQQLHRHACIVAAQIMQAAPAPARIVLALPQGLDFIGAFFGCHYANCTPVPVYPPDSAKSLPRFLRIVSDSEAAVVLCTAAIAAKCTDALRDLQSPPVIVPIDTFIALDAEADGDVVQPVLPHPDALALLQYTSGTTSAPKGVMISHRNLLENERAMSQAFALGESPRVVSWLPFFHDMGLMGGLLFPVFNGIPATLFSTTAFLRNPALWPQLISARRATISPAPNFAYDLCARVARDEQIQTLDLSCWGCAICGAEAVRRSTVDQFIARFSSAGFRAENFIPAYGLAESTLFVCADTRNTLPIFASPAGVDKDRGYASCGPCIAADVRIVDAQSGRQLDDGIVGEIWIRSGSVGRGYWKQPQQSREIFDAAIANSGESGFLRTGDLGFRRGDDLYVTGRLKELIILRGRNYVPQDIESIAREALPAAAAGQCAAFAVERDYTEALILVIEFNRRRVGDVPLAHSVADVRMALRGALSIDADDIVLVRQNALPRTSSGKLQRTQVRDQYLSRQLQRLEDTTVEPS